MYEIIDLRTGEVVKVLDNIEEAEKQLPEGIYEVRYHGRFVKFLSVIDENHKCWI